VAAADVGEEADADLRHGEQRVLRHDPVRAVEGNANAAAHDDAVDQRDVRLGKACDPGVQPVLVGEEPDRRVAGQAGLVDIEDIAARRERPALAADDDQRDARVALPGVERGVERTHHAVSHRVERLRPRHRDDAGRADSFEADLVAAAEIDVHSSSTVAGMKC
jgi:hypothetical protein